MNFLEELLTFADVILNISMEKRGKLRLNIFKTIEMNIIIIIIIKNFNNILINDQYIERIQLFLGYWFLWCGMNSCAWRSYFSYWSEVLVIDVFIEANFCSVFKGIEGEAWYFRKDSWSLGRGGGVLQWTHSCECEHSFGLGRVGITTLWLGDNKVSWVYFFLCGQGFRQQIPQTEWSVSSGPYRAKGILYFCPYPGFISHFQGNRRYRILHMCSSLWNQWWCMFGFATDGGSE